MQCPGVRWRESGQDIAPPIYIAAQRGYLDVASVRSPSVTKTHLTSPQLIEQRQCWHMQRLLWVGHLRESSDRCALARLPRSVLLRVVYFLVPRRRYFPPSSP